MEEKDYKKWLISFYSYARHVATIREGIEHVSKKEEFDREVVMFYISSGSDGYDGKMPLSSPKSSQQKFISIFR